MMVVLYYIIARKEYWLSYVVNSIVSMTCWVWVGV